MTETVNKQNNLHYPFILGVVLMAALTYRFFDLGSQGLWGEGLSNAYVATLENIGDIFTYVADNDDQPPGYVLILRLLTSLLDTSDATLLLTAALTSLLAVCLTYRLGKLYFSETAGLLAACVLAGAYQDIFYSQATQVYAMFSCAALLHLGFFMQVFVNSEWQNEFYKPLDPWKYKIAGLSLSWQSTIPRDVIVLRGFWITGIILLYLHTMGMAVIASELLVAAVLCFRAERQSVVTKLARAFVLPLAVFVFWMPSLLKQVIRIFSTSPTSVFDLWGAWRFLCGPDLLRAQVTLIAFIFSLALVIYFCVKGKDKEPTGFFLLLVAFLALTILFFLLAQVFIPSIQSKRALLFMGPLVYLLAVYGLARMIDEIPYASVQAGVLLIIVLCILVIQLDKNKKGGLLMAATPEVRKAIQLIRKDSTFMNGPRKVLFSHDVVQYYIKHDGIPYPVNGFVNAWEEYAILRGTAFIRPDEFYYVELQNPADASRGSMLFRYLVSHYAITCRSNLNQVILVKFNTLVTPAPSAETIETYQCPYGSKKTTNPDVNATVVNQAAGS